MEFNNVQEIERAIGALPPEQLAELYAWLEQNRPLSVPASPSEQRHVSELVREIWSDLPDGARAELPSDGAAQVDHYVYGLPKRDQ